jgi:hypothetical protein
MSPQAPKGTEFVEQPGLNRFKGFEQVTGIFVPKEKTIDFPNYSVRKDGKGAISETLTFNKKSINEEQRKKSTELAYTDLPTAIGRISANQAIEKYFLENKVEDLDIGSEKDDLGEVSYYIGVRGDKESRIPIEQDDYISATVIRRLPSTSKTFGAPLAITQAKEEAAPAPAAGVAKKLSLEEIARGGAAPAAAPPAQPVAAPAAQAAPVLSEGNPFAKLAKADFETAKTVKAVQEKMATEARRITETREAKKELEKVNQEIARLNEPRKGASPLMAGLKLSEAKATEKAIEWEKLNTKKKQLERLLSSR